MGLKIYWTDFAKAELNDIFKFYYENVGLKVAKNIITGIISHTLSLSLQPEMGAVELLLDNRKINFRYLVYKNYKIIYWYNKEKNRIDILDVFDTRQNPIKMERI